MAEPTIPPGLSFDHVPQGFSALEHQRVLGTPFEEAVQRLTGWRMHAGAGFRVAASGPPSIGLDLVSSSRVLGIPVTAPCRVLEVEHAPTSYRMVYATLPGHPLCGIEEFRVEQGEGRVVATIRAVSRPAWRLARLAPPVVRREQRRIASRYLASLDSG